MKKLTSCLWFDNQAEEAANFYCSVFKDSKIGKIARYPEGSPGPAGEVMTVEFELNGQKFLGLNGGPHFKFTEAVSFIIDCDGQEEVDYYWDKLLEGGGQPSQCGWLKDKYGLSWQVTPRQLPELMTKGTKEQGERVMQAMLKMSKIDVQKIQDAYDGK
jgi:predicted 3-demethylubiquinone-9 3-methyltransferase (glyoxalase superfamily)